MKRQHVRPEFFVSDEMLRRGLGFNRGQWRSIKRAADDAYMPVRDYMRLMLLCAAGHGGVIEHAERAVAASFDADKTGAKVKVEYDDDDMPIECSWEDG